MTIVDVVRPDELGVREVRRWHELQASYIHLDSPFLSPTFATAVSRLRPATRVAVIREGTGIGFLPFELGRGGHGRALAMGLSDLQGLVADPSLEIDPVELLHKCGLRSFTFDHLTARQRDWVQTAPSHVSADVSRVLDLSRGYDAWVADCRAASKGLLQSSARKLRKLEREHGAVRLVYDYPDHAALEKLLGWKSHQYRRTSRRDIFADLGTRAFVHDLLERGNGEFGAPLSVLTAGDTMIAAHFGLRSKRTLAWWFPVYDIDFSCYSPGLILSMAIAKAISADGAAVLDLGKGDEPYKERLSNSSIGLLSGAIGVNRHARALHVMKRWPRERAMAMVLSSPTLRRCARTTLARIGQLRVAGSHPPSAVVPVLVGPPMGTTPDSREGDSGNRR
jgi:CelD/BcsL family acetyltransferase involved in cellulose biosynthesis